eukprot:2171915-Pleurochrysis_carterae.AAC.1
MREKERGREINIERGSERGKRDGIENKQRTRGNGVGYACQNTAQREERKGNTSKHVDRVRGSWFEMHKWRTLPKHKCSSSEQKRENEVLSADASTLSETRKRTLCQKRENEVLSADPPAGGAQTSTCSCSPGSFPCGAAPAERESTHALTSLLNGADLPVELDSCRARARILHTAQPRFDWQGLASSHRARRGNSAFQRVQASMATALLLG